MGNKTKKAPKKKSKLKNKEPKGRHLVLSSSKRIVLSINYGFCSVPRRDNVTGRYTRIYCKFEDGKTMQAQAICAPEDQFNYYEGKKRALRKLFDLDLEHVLLTKQDRREIVQLCLPRYFGNEIPKLAGWRSDKK
jgi:hypothetical protein